MVELILKSIFIIVFLALLIYAIYMTFKLLREKENRYTREYYTSLDISDEKINILDRLVNIEFENYIRYHPDTFDLSGSSYIKESDFSGIITEITSRVCLRLTPAIKENVMLTYNLGYEDLVRLIGEKVGLNLAIAASEVNQALLEEPTSTTISM